MKSIPVRETVNITKLLKESAVINLSLNLFVYKSMKLQFYIKNYTNMVGEIVLGVT